MFTPFPKLTSIPIFDLPSNAYFSVDDLYQLLYSLRKHFSPGPDDLTGDFFLTCEILYLGHSGSYLENDYLVKIIFPSLVKTSTLLLLLKPYSLQSN